MKKFLKWLGIVIGALLLVILIAGFSMHFVGRSRLNKAPDLASHPVDVPANSAAVQRGEYMVNAVGQCRLCHGENLEGTVFMEGEIGIYLPAPNLTSGMGGIGGKFSNADWERAIRHGVGADGRVLVIMPSNFYSHLGDDDLGALIAYLKQIPAVDNDLGARSIGFPGSLLGGVIAFDDFTRINGIDHAAVGATPAPAAAATADYGQYLVEVAMCKECHAANLAGLYTHDGPPPGPNLTPAGNLANWSEADFISTIRTGFTPEKRVLDVEEMPWDSYLKMSDEDLSAIFLYLQSLPAITPAE